MDEKELLDRIAYLERRLDWLYMATGHGYAAGPAQGVTTGGGVSPLVMQYLQQGNKIQAIKQYREETGVGLKEAKDVIDALG